VAAVHHETTTRRLNALAPLGALCRDHAAGLLLDAVSSFAAEALALDSCGIAACAARARKCLHGALGLACAAARRAPLARQCRPPRPLYLDLSVWAGEQARGGAPFTSIVPAYHALREALDELSESGGWRARGARYRALAERVRAGLEALKVRPGLPPGAAVGGRRRCAAP